MPHEIIMFVDNTFIYEVETFVYLNKTYQYTYVGDTTHIWVEDTFMYVYDIKIVCIITQWYCLVK